MAEQGLFPPGYAAVLASTHFLTGSTTPVWLLLGQSAVLLAAAVHLSIQSRPLLGRLGSLVLLALCTLTPATIEVSTSLMYEGLLVPASMFLCGGVLLWFRSDGREGSWVMAAASLAMVALHPRSLVIPVAIALTLVIGCRKVAAPALVTLAALIPLPALAFRNLAAQGTFNLSSNLGSNLAMGLPPDDEAVCSAAVFPPSDYPRLNPADDARFLECSIQQIGQHPLQWILQAPQKLLDHFEPAFLRIVSGDRAPVVLLGDSAVAFLKVAVVVLFVTLSVLGALWVWRSPRDGGTLAVALSLPVLLTAATSVAFYGRERFSYPSLPFAMLLVVCGLTWISVRCVKALRSWRGA